MSLHETTPTASKWVWAVDEAHNHRDTFTKICQKIFKPNACVVSEQSTPTGLASISTKR